MHEPGPGHGRVVPLRDHPVEEASLGMLYELVGDCVLWIGRDGALRAISRSMRVLLEEIGQEIGRPVRFCSDLPFDKPDADAVKLLLESEEVEHELVLVLRRRGTASILRSRFRVDALQGGWFSVWRDETRLRRAEAEVLRLGRLRALGAFGAGIAHDFNNVLGALLGMADHLAQVTDDPAEKRFLETVRASTREGAAMVQRLASLLDRAPIEREVLPLAELVRRSLEFFEKHALLRGITVRTELGRDLPKVRVVPHDAITALLQLYLLGFATGGPITVLASLETVPAVHAGLPTRTYGVVRILDSGDPMVHAALAEACSHGERGLARHLDRLPEGRAATLLALVTVQAQGARFETEVPREGQRSAVLRFPAARG